MSEQPCVFKEVEKDVWYCAEHDVYLIDRNLRARVLKDAEHALQASRHFWRYDTIPENSPDESDLTEDQLLLRQEPYLSMKWFILEELAVDTGDYCYVGWHPELKTVVVLFDTFLGCIHTLDGVEHTLENPPVCESFVEALRTTAYLDETKEEYWKREHIVESLFEVESEN